jgi:hypothetical protein
MLTQLKAVKRLLGFGIASTNNSKSENAGILRFAQNDRLKIEVDGG